MKKVLFFIFSFFICTTCVFADYSINDIHEYDFLFPLDKYVIDDNYGDYGTKNLIFEYYNYGYDEEPIYTYVYPNTTEFKNAFCTDEDFCITNGVVEIPFFYELNVEKISYNSASNYVLFKVYVDMYGQSEGSDDPMFLDELLTPIISTQLSNSKVYVVDITLIDIHEDESIYVSINNTGSIRVDDESSYVKRGNYYVFNNMDKGNTVRFYFSTPGDKVTITAYASAPEYLDSNEVSAYFVVPESSSPTDPTDPTDPTEPTNPTDPTDPDEPSEPTDSGDASETGKDSEKSTDSLINPNTIDYVLLLGGVLITSLLLTITLRKNRRLFIK